MRTCSCAVALLGLALAAPAPALAQEKDALALLEKAMKAHGGADQLAKYKAYTSKMKGTINTMGMEIPFTGEIATQGSTQQKVVIEAEAGGQTFRIIHVLNGDKGWLKLGDNSKEMSKDELAEAKHQTYTDSVARLAGLKDKAFTLTTLGEAKVGDRPALGLRVSRKGQRDINLFFDSKTNLLVKIESRVKDDATGQEVTEESVLSGHTDKGTRQAMRIVVRRDGKAFLEADLTDYREEEKLDAGLFAEP